MSKQMVMGIMRDLDAEAARYKRRTDSICKAAHGAREHEIMRTMCRYELESDEFYTAREKAISLLKGV